MKARIASVVFAGALAALCQARDALAMDMENSVRQLHQTGSWTSLEFRDPTLGRFLAGRASTEDARKNITFNVTFALIAGNCKESTEIVVKAAEPFKEKFDGEKVVEIQIDDGPTQNFPARLEESAGDPFAFFQLIAPPSMAQLQGARSMLVNVRGFAIGKFALNGMPEAVAAARAACANFATAGEPPQGAHEREMKLAETAGAYVAAHVMAQEFKKSPCGRDIDLDNRWTDVNRATEEILQAFSAQGRAEVEKGLPGLLDGMRQEWRRQFNDPRLEGKCDGAKNVFWTNFDRAVKQWQQASKH